MRARIRRRAYRIPEGWSVGLLVMGITLLVPMVMWSVAALSMLLFTFVPSD
jgi:hypothetical protein